MYILKSVIQIQEMRININVQHCVMHLQHSYLLPGHDTVVLRLQACLYFGRVKHIEFILNIFLKVFKYKRFLFSSLVLHSYRYR